MFKIKKTDNNIYAPLKGRCIDITDVNDIAFSSKSMGDGIAIIPKENIIKSPCDGYIKMIFRTKHAIGIQAINGAEILIHIGIDTANLNGVGFKVYKKLNEKVKKGDSLIAFDLENLEKKYDMSTMIIITNKMPFEKANLNHDVTAGICILKG